ncbi:hypothetical protein ACTXT7_016734 [Hymenolepis weldensis]
MNGDSSHFHLLKIIKEATKGEDTETSAAALALYDSLTIKCHSLYTLMVESNIKPHSPQLQWISNGFTSKDASHLERSQLEEIVQGILDASQCCDEDSALISLREHFLNLKKFLRRQDHVPMQREIESSGLPSAIFNCLALSRCEFWKKSVGANTLDDHLNYLLKRRREFLQHFHHSQELLDLFGLLVNIFEPNGSYYTHLFDILPQVKMIEDAEYEELLMMPNSRRKKKSKLSALLPLKGRRLESSTNYGVLETIAQWFPNLKTACSPINAEKFLAGYNFLLKFQTCHDDELTYLNDVRGHIITAGRITINHIIGSVGSIFDHWYDCERNEIEMFKPFYARTGGSTIDFENESFIGQNEIHIQHPMLKEQQTELFDTSILEGKHVGSRLCVDTGLDLIPTAYCLSCIYDCGRRSSITNWCLQGSNNGNEWINLSSHK